MQDYQNAFIKLAIQHKALCFGEYILKSGRVSPYFFNAGQFQTGSALSLLGKYYAKAIVDADIDINTLFGPAYKGIPLVTTTAAAMFDEYQRDYPLCYNRKEVKNHGEGGVLIGARLKGKVAIIDDVITAGTAVREAITIIRQSGAEPSAVVVGLDRQERGTGKMSAIQEVEQSFGIPVISLIQLEHIVEYLQEQQSQHLLTMMEYRKNYGV